MNLITNNFQYIVNFLESEKSFLKISGSSLSFENKMSYEDTIYSLNHLKKIVGERRLKRIIGRTCNKNEISKFELNTLKLTKDVVTKIFAGLTDIRKEDLDEIPTGTIEEKYRALFPFKKIDDFEKTFFNKNSPLTKDSIYFSTSAGKGEAGLIERNYVAIHHHFKIMSEGDQEAMKLREIEMLTSRFASNEPPKGSVIHLKEGFYYVDRVIADGGAFIIVLKDLEEKKCPKIICRGTALTWSATGGVLSGLNDLQLEIGEMGIQKVWPALNKYLTRNKIREVELLGKSLGGNHAQQLTILCETIGVKVKKLTTNCSPGVSKTINKIFQDEVLSKYPKNDSIHIEVLRNGGDQEQNGVDCIPQVGGEHLGTNTDSKKCNIKVTYIHPDTNEVSTLPKHKTITEFARNFFNSFVAAHTRQSTVENFTWKHITNQREIQQHLKSGNSLEPIRKLFALAAHCLSFAYLNGKSFEEYYQKQDKRKGVI